jgi:hypothetical protein
MKIGPVRGELFYVDGQTDMMKVIVAFRNFANAPKTESAVSSLYYISVFKSGSSVRSLYYTCL